VKQHPGAPGDLTTRELFALKRIPGVRLIDPGHHSLDLINRAAATIVIQNTAGWETFLMRRPLVVLSSEPYYSYSRLVHKVEDICDLSKALASAIRAGRAAYEERADEWYWFIQCVLSSAHPGRFVTFDPPYFDMNNADHAHAVARSLYNKMTRSVASSTTAASAL
jgi:hypothetical protein